MTLQQLRYALGIADAGSFSRAAARLYISQPSLTAAIHALESELGIALFRRTVHGATVTKDGAEFLAQARELYSGYETLLSHYGEGARRKQTFAVSTQHYSFAVKSFVELVKRYDTDEYEFAIRETRTRDVVEDVASLRSEIGVLYLSDFNRHVLGALLRARSLEFTRLISCKAYVYLYRGHPLARRRSITFAELAPYPCLSFEQGGDVPWAFAEEILATEEYHRTIKATDRATMLNLMLGLNGYTLCSGIICEELNGSDYVAVPFRDVKGGINRTMEIGYIRRRGVAPTALGEAYVAEMREYLKRH